MAISSVRRALYGLHELCVIGVMPHQCTVIIRDWSLNPMQDAARKENNGLISPARFICVDHHEWCSSSLCLSIVGLAGGINLSYTHSASVELTTQWEGISCVTGCLTPVLTIWCLSQLLVSRASPPTVNLTVSKSECTQQLLIARNFWRSQKVLLCRKCDTGLYSEQQPEHRRREGAILLSVDLSFHFFCFEGYFLTTLWTEVDFTWFKLKNSHQ